MKSKFILLLLAVFSFFACEDDKTVTFPEPPVYDMTGFAKGADISWLTEMEKTGRLFYSLDGKPTECMELLRNLGMNAIRLRVWVNPADGWCNKGDVLAKAFRAHQLGMRLMIDFHYSDSWADPGQQTKPAAWQNLPFDDLTEALANHTTDILSALKELGIYPEWIQIGNETMPGMLWEEGRLPDNTQQYANLNNAGYDAAKAIFPDAKMIIHFHGGEMNNMYRIRFDALRQAGAKWDVIGMSLYPEADTWQTMVTACYNNMVDMADRYDTEVMVCEVGMNWEEAEECKAFLSEIIAKTKSIVNDKGLGVFYWEPQSYGNWKGYSKGAFDDSGMPTVALDAFTN